MLAVCVVHQQAISSHLFITVVGTRSNQPTAGSDSDESRSRSKSSPDGASVRGEGDSQSVPGKISNHDM